MDTPVEKKLKSLEKLQSIDSKLDEIKKVRGDLPEEVQDLEDEIAGYQTRVDKFEAEVKDLETAISNHRTGMKDAEKLIEKYKDQQMNVRNNREFDAITKEMELQDLEIQVCEKKIKEAHIAIEQKKVEIEKVSEVLNERTEDLNRKNEELENIVAESEEEERKLMVEREKAVKAVEDRLLKSYEKIRNNARNGLAVVSVMRDACGGCFNTVPPQRQADIRERKKIIVCEHCGRILTDVEEVVEEEKPKRKTRTRKTTKA